MNKKTRIITISALFSALATVSLYIASVWPTGQLGLAAFSSLFVAAGVIEAGLKPGIYIYIISSAISLLILPDRSAPLLFVLFFGYYPVIKSLIERIGSAILRWLIKFFVFNASLSVIYFLLSNLIFDLQGRTPGITVLYLGGNIIFALFDHGFTKVIWFYINRLSNESNRTRG